VKPLPADYRLPTDGVLDPSRKDLFIDGKLEGGSQPRSQDGARGFELK
jgi:pilus assembly protein CpaC